MFVLELPQSAEFLYCLDVLQMCYVLLQRYLRVVQLRCDCFLICSRKFHAKQVVFLCPVDFALRNVFHEMLVLLREFTHARAKPLCRVAQLLVLVLVESLLRGQNLLLAQRLQLGKECPHFVLQALRILLVALSLFQTQLLVVLAFLLEELYLLQKCFPLLRPLLLSLVELYLHWGCLLTSPGNLS